MYLGSAWELIAQELNNWLTIAVSMLPNIALAALIFFLAWVVGRMVGRAVERLLTAVTPNKLLVQSLRSLSHALVVGLGGFVVLAILNLDQAVTSLLMGLGVLLLAVAFAFQDIASSFFAGLLITVRQPFEVGDIIETNDVKGTVSEMSLRTTEIRTFEGTTVRIPNKRIFQAPLVNHSHLGKRRIHVQGAVALDTDATAARDAGIAAVSRLSLRDPDREVEFYWDGFTGPGMTFSIYCWIDFAKEHDYRVARSEAIVAVRSSFAEAGIQMVPLTRTTSAASEG